MPVPEAMAGVEETGSSCRGVRSVLSVLFAVSATTRRLGMVSVTCFRQNQAPAFEHRGREGPDFVGQRSLGQQVAEPALDRIRGQNFGRTQARESAPAIAQNGEKLLLVNAVQGFADEADVFPAVSLLGGTHKKVQPFARFGFQDPRLDGQDRSDCALCGADEASDARELVFF